MKNTLRVALGLTAAALVGCEMPMMPFGDQNVVLSDKPIVLGAQATHLAAAEPLKVVGMTSNLCLALADDVANDTHINAKYQELKGGAHLSAILHTSGGADVVWTCGSWSLSADRSGRGVLSACLRWECNQTPPRGTEITSIDLSSDRPLRILGANWQSTAAFDHVAEPVPDLSASASAEYRELEQRFGGKLAWPSRAKTALQVELFSNRREKSFSTYNSTLAIRLEAEGIQIQPGPRATGMDVVTIPTAAVDACSMSCSGELAKDVNLLLSEPGIEIDLLNSPEVIDWCWQNRIPMATSAARRAWLYTAAPLPDRKTYSQQLSSRSAYDEQARCSCAGY